MTSLSDIPEPVLEDILFRVAASTRYFSWLFTLRLVNRQFNDSFLHVIFFRRPRSLQLPRHEVPCEMEKCVSFNCDIMTESHRKAERESILVRCVFLSLWAKPNPIGLNVSTARLFENLREALELLRKVVKAIDLTQAQLQLYPICTRNEVFNDLASTILAEALQYCVGYRLITSLDYLSSPDEISVCNWRGPIQVLTLADRSPAFWVALSACVMGDIATVRKYSRKAAPDQEVSSNPHFVPHAFLYLKVAARCARINVVKALLNKHPDAMLDEVPYGSGSILEAAVRSQDKAVLEVVLQHTPDPDSAIEQVISWDFALIGKDKPSAASLRMLMRYLTPATLRSSSSVSRVVEMMVYHASMQGDTSLLDDLVRSGVIIRCKNFENQIDHSYPNALTVAAREGNQDSMCSLLDHGFLKEVSPSRLEWAVKRAGVSALLRNHPDSFRELRRRYPDAMYKDHRVFGELGYAEDVEDIMREFMAKFDGLPGHIDQLGAPTYGEYFTSGQLSLYGAIRRLRPSNVEFLLKQGVIPYQGNHMQRIFEIPWPYFNKNRAAFDRVQAALEAYKLPKLCIIL